MPDVADTDTGAARQHWRAALAVLALAVGASTAGRLAPGWPVLTAVAHGLAFAAAGFAATRLALTRGEGGVGRRWLAACAAALRWGLPGLATVVVAVLAIGVVLLPPADLTHQAWTALWTALGVGGLHLMRQGVPGPALGGELLLHLWAPGVAAQLFAGWTLVVIVAVRRRLGRWIGALAGMGVLLSLGLAFWMRAYGLHPQAFYLAPAHAWPFLIGAVLAWLPIRTAGSEAVWRAPLARLGQWAWPFFLWLWPLAALPRMILARPLTPAEGAAVLAASGLLALATRRWIETPVQRRLADRPLTTVAFAAAGCGALVVLSAAILTAQGFPARADAAVLAEEAAALRRSPLQSLCNIEDGRRLPPAAGCTTPAGGAAAVIVWGNSHAALLTPAILDWASGGGLRTRQVTRSGCLPLIVSAGGLADRDCLAFNRAAVEEMAEGPRPRLVILGAAWTVIPARSPGADRKKAAALERGLAATVRRVRTAVGPEAGIVLLGTTPDYAFAPAACHARRRFLDLDTGRCDLAPPANARMAAVMDRALARIAADHPGVHVFDPASALCREGLCRTRGPDGPWYADHHHLTPAGARAQSEALAAVLERASARP